MVIKANSDLSIKNYQISCEKILLPGILTIPSNAESVVAFAHGSGSGRLSKRNQYVANVLQNAGVATFQFDLLNETEAVDEKKSLI